MKNLFLAFALIMSTMLFSCSKDDNEPSVNITISDITGGTWYVTEQYTDGAWIDVSSVGMRATFLSDGRYTVAQGTVWNGSYYRGTWELSGNTVEGVTVDGIKEHFKFASLQGINATIDYSNSDGGAYKWKAKKSVD